MDGPSPGWPPHAIMDGVPDAVLARFPKLADLDVENLDFANATFFGTTTARATDLYIGHKHSTGDITLEGTTWSLRK